MRLEKRLRRTNQQQLARGVASLLYPLEMKVVNFFYRLRSFEKLYSLVKPCKKSENAPEINGGPLSDTNV